SSIMRQSCASLTQSIPKKRRIKRIKHTKETQRQHSYPYTHKFWSSEYIMRQFTRNGAYLRRGVTPNVRAARWLQLDCREYQPCRWYLFSINPNGRVMSPKTMR